MEQFHHSRTVFVKEDREMGKVVQKPPLFTRQSRSMQRCDCRAIQSRTLATKSGDKIADVTVVLEYADLPDS